MSIVHDSDSTSSHVENSEVDHLSEPPSKSQRKRDALAVRQLGEEIAALGQSEIAALPLPDDVRQAVDELRRISRHGARKRQLGYLAGRLRNCDLDPIHAALDKLRAAGRQANRDHHRVEHWRDRLLGDIEGDDPASALTAFIDTAPGADRQRLRQLQRQALRERADSSAPRAARELFREIRRLLSAEPT